MTTGPLHWELLLRGRAVDNQVIIHSKLEGLKELVDKLVVSRESFLKMY